MSYLAEINRLGPYAYYRLGESGVETTATDSARGTRSGTHYNTPTLGSTGLLTGDSDTSAYYNSTNSEYTDISNGLPTTSTGSVAFSVKFGSGETCAITVSRTASDNDYIIFSINSTKAVFWYENPSASGTPGTDYFSVETTSGFSNNTTYHVVFVQDDTNGVLIYVNGSQQTTQVGSGTPGNKWWDDMGGTPVYMSIQALRKTSTTYYSGYIDEVAIYEDRLSGSEISDLYTTATTTPDALGNYEAAVFDLDVVSYWRLGETGSTAYDETGRNDGTYVNNPNTNQTGLLYDDLDKCCAFNHSLSHHVSTPYITHADSTMSVSLLLKPGSTAINQIIFSDCNSSGAVTHMRLALAIRASGYWRLYLGDGTDYWLEDSSSPHGLVVGNTYHIVLTINANVLKLYVDGSLAFTSTTTNGVELGTLGVGTFHIARNGESGSQYTNGYIDEVVIFRDELSSGEVTNLYEVASGTGGSNIAPLAMHHLNMMRCA